MKFKRYFTYISVIDLAVHRITGGATSGVGYVQV